MLQYERNPSLRMLGAVARVGLTCNKRNEHSLNNNVFKKKTGMKSMNVAET